MAGVVAQTELPDEVLAVPAVLARVLPPVPVAGRRVAGGSQLRGQAQGKYITEKLGEVGHLG